MFFGCAHNLSISSSFSSWNLSTSSRDFRCDIRFSPESWMNTKYVRAQRIFNLHKSTTSFGCYPQQDSIPEEEMDAGHNQSVQQETRHPTTSQHHEATISSVCLPSWNKGLSFIIPKPIIFNKNDTMWSLCCALACLCRLLAFRWGF